MTNDRPARMRIAKLCLTLLAMLGIYACSRMAVYQEVPAPLAAKPTVHYQRDVQPIFDRTCVACHACNDAPCQLNLASAEGIIRGASKLPVYDGLRSEDQAPTRLGVDALNVEAWRAKGFFSARYAAASDGTAPLQASLLYRMVELGHTNPWPPDSKLPDELTFGRDRQHQCPTVDEFEDYAEKRPQQGMPWAMTGLSDGEFRTLQTWIAEGGAVEARSPVPSPREQAAVERWEQYLNRSGAREQLVARYLYEHLFLAHLYFEGEDKPLFFELIRSRTPSGQTPIPLSTVRPNDDPGAAFHYRLRPLSETLVNKTHITYGLSDRKRQRYDALFFADDWTVGVLPGYSDAERANAFSTFAAIPAKARYQFMLDDAEYFVRTFIRGPVCSGQIATDVIRDQFWVLFEDPAAEVYVNDAAYRQQATPLIGVPGQDSDLIATHSEWEKYREQRNHYVELRQARYASDQPQGPRLADLWDGDGWNRDAMLTIFRHHDNAAVERGWHGALPDTLWVMDYPLLERSYYQLVVNFNVFGSVSHQLQTRLYFDLIRNEGEYNFLRFLPASERKKLRDAWYADSGKIKLFTTYAKPDDQVPTQIVYRTDDPKAEFAGQVLERLRKVRGPADLLNRCEQERCERQSDSAVRRQVEHALRTFAGVRAAQLPVIALLPELVYLRVTAPGGERMVYSLVHNRAHSNVAFLLGEELRREPDKDTLSVLPGILGSYPNFIFDVAAPDIEAFVERLASITKAAELEPLVERWGVRRTHPAFWEIFHDFTRYVEQTDPVEAALFDLNRYENL